jgi:competence protein ComEA
MNPENKPLLKWFGYSRRERRSTFILLLIILIIISIRYLVPEKNLSIEEVAAKPFTFSDPVNNAIENTDSLNLFNFDPNNASFETLVKLGLSEKQAKTILSYRSKGGKFRKSSDISKIYGINDDLVKNLLPYVKIEYDTLLSKRQDVYRKALLDLNKCDSALLDNLPGIGPVLSARIIKYRNRLGGFVSKGQLKEVYGLTAETYNRIQERLFADSSVIYKIKINGAEYKDLIKHPYFDKYDIKAILKYKELNGRISDMNELIDNKLLTEERAKRIKPYLIF